MINYKNGKINKIPELKISDEKELPIFEFNLKYFSNLKNWALEFIFRKK